MSTIFQNLGFALGLIAAPSLAYAEGVQSGTWTPAGQEQAQTATQASAQKYVARKKATSRSRKAEERGLGQDSRIELLEMQAAEVQRRGQQQDKAIADVRKEVGKTAEELKREAEASKAADQAHYAWAANLQRNQRDLDHLVARTEVQSRRFAMEAGAHYARVEGINKVSVQAALCYLGNKITFCAGAGVGKAGELTSTTDLTRPESRTRNGEYTEAASQAGTQTSGQRYLWNGSLRVAPPAPGSRVGRRWTVTPSLGADIAFNRARETRDVTRTTQLYRGNQTVGNPVSATGHDAEYDTEVAVTPTAAFDACRYLWSRGSGKNLCARVGVGYDPVKEQGTLTLGGLIRFQ